MHIIATLENAAKLIPLASRFKQLEEGGKTVWKLSKGRRRIIKGKEGTTWWYLGTGGGRGVSAFNANNRGGSGSWNFTFA